MKRLMVIEFIDSGEVRSVLGYIGEALVSARG